MIPAANRYTAVLNASVLFANMKRDLLLRFFEADLYQASWTKRIWQEWLTNAISQYPMLDMAELAWSASGTSHPYQ